jgi:hypothetical protein
MDGISVLGISVLRIRLLGIRLCPTRVLSAQRKDHGEGEAATRCLGRADHAVMSFDHGLGDGQPQAGAALFAGT